MVGGVLLNRTGKQRPHSQKRQNPVHVPSVPTSGSSGLATIALGTGFFLPGPLGGGGLASVSVAGGWAAVSPAPEEPALPAISVSAPRTALPLDRASVGHPDRRRGAGRGRLDEVRYLLLSLA